MIRCKEIDDYIAYAEEHPGWINKERRQLLENIVKPLINRDDVYMDDDKLQKAIAFVQTNYYPLFPYQKFVYAMAFIRWKNDHQLVFQKFIIKMGRGNGKDGFIMPLLQYFMTPLYGIKEYHVELVANSEKQIEDSYKVCYGCVTESKKLKKKFKVTKSEMIDKSTKSIMRFNTSNGKTKDGKRPGAVLMNEVHGYKDFNEINVYESGLGKVEDPRVFIITTDGYEREGALDQIEVVCAEILETGENMLGWFPFICKLDDEKEIDSEEAWHKANPSMEFRPVLYRQIKKDYLEMLKLPTKRPEFKTKRCNLKAEKNEGAITEWINILRCSYEGNTMEELQARRPRMVEDTKGNAAVIGIDYADVRDFASAGVLTKTEAGEYVWIQKTWICSQSPFFESIRFPMACQGQYEYQDFEVVNEPVIPKDAIIRWVKERMSEYDVKKIAMDTYRWSLFKQEFEEEGFSIESRDNPDGLVRLIRKIGNVTGMIAPLIETAFAEGKIWYGPSAIMRWYTNNTCINIDKNGNKTFGKIEPKLRKNDGFMAFDVAFFCQDLLEVQVIYI